MVCICHPTLQRVMREVNAKRNGLKSKYEAQLNAAELEYRMRSTCALHAPGVPLNRDLAKPEICSSGFAIVV